MGIVKTIKGNNYYESVETEPHDSLLYKLLQSIEYDTIITDTFRVKRIKRVMKKDTKTLYYVYLDGPDKIYKLVTISDNADKDIIKDFKKLKTRHKYVLTLYPKHIKPDDGIPHIIAGNEELEFDVFWIPYFDFKYHLQNFEFNSGIYHYEGRNVHIGKNVTNEAPQGNVIVKPNTTLTVKGTQSVQTTDNFEVKVGGKFIIK